MFPRGRGFANTQTGNLSGIPGSIRISDMDPGMDVWIASKIPDHMRSLEFPVVPDLVTTNVRVVVEGKMEIIEPCFFDESNSTI